MYEQVYPFQCHGRVPHGPEAVGVSEELCFEYWFQHNPPNVYLDMMDEWISKQWENKNTLFSYGRQNSRLSALSKRTTLTPGYLVRYADICQQWADEPTLWSPLLVYLAFIHNSGFQHSLVVRGKSRRGYISRTIPDRDRLKRKVDQIAEEIKNIPECYSREQLIENPLPLVLLQTAHCCEL